MTKFLLGCLMQVGLTMDRFPNSSELQRKMTNGAVVSGASQPKSKTSEAKGHHEPYEAPDYLRISNLITPGGIRRVDHALRGWRAGRGRTAADPAQALAPAFQPRRSDYALKGGDHPRQPHIAEKLSPGGRGASND